MTEELIIAGFGGQGVLSMGKILAYSGVKQGNEVTWFPSYGPEMRGGTANVTVILSDKSISSPILNEFDTAIILNQQSMDRFEDSVKPGGVILYDPNGIVTPPKRRDVNIYSIEAVKLSGEMGNHILFNMIVMGAFLQAKPVINMDYIERGLESSLPERHHRLIPKNLEAIEMGKKHVVSIHTI